MEFEIEKVNINEENAGEHAALLDTLIALSAEWAGEGSCAGYYANDADEYFDKELYVARAEGKTVGYALGHIKVLEEKTSYNSIGEKAFELDELFVTNAFRGQGIARALFRFAENDLRDKVTVIGLTAATKHSKQLLKLYIEELGRSFNHALRVKRPE
ncbi:MAG: GNAT family N-acetyltransferase, partial [Clostridia bacterium]|nr:GNAT family N-acetyltransferase [Clostridia bacterium]